MSGSQTPAGQVAILSTRWGVVETVSVAAGRLYTFPEPLAGLPASRRYALLDDPATVPLCWLQSLEEAAVCLPVLPLGGTLLGEYAGQVERALGLGAAAAAARVLLVTRYDQQGGMFVANLLAPVVLDPQSGVGRQVVLEGQGQGQGQGEPPPLRQPLVWQPGRRRFTRPC